MLVPPGDIISVLFFISLDSCQLTKVYMKPYLVFSLLPPDLKRALVSLGGSTLTSPVSPLS